MDFTQLRYFYEVTRAGTIRDACRQLNVAASAVSRQIQLLEQQVGMPLFERHPRGMRLTEAGKIYAQHVKLVMLDEERTRSELAALMGLEQGSVRLAAVEGLVGDYITDAMGGFRTQHPGIAFDLHVTGTDDVVAAVRSGEADIGLAFNAKPEREVEFRFRLVDQLNVFCAPDHPLAQKASVSLREVLSHPVAVPITGFGIRAMIDECCRIEGLRLKPALLTNSIDALRAFAKAGLGLSMNSLRSCQREVATGHLRAIPLADRALQSASMDVMVLAGRKLPVAVEAFLAQLHRSAEAQGAAFVEQQP
ncbi:LysR family transcriptional regulator [Aquabacter sp. CN5-332]|uniref:LysR family transcriptional regulator n=1 Tax=Aquabacter sp. CN5-332 TaxID=3156608 RepID=UPI0032B552F9